MRSKALMLAVLFIATMAVSACHKEEGPMEKAGQKLDNAAGEMQDAAKDAAEKAEDAVEGEH